MDVTFLYILCGALGITSGFFAVMLVRANDHLQNARRSERRATEAAEYYERELVKVNKMAVPPSMDSAKLEALQGLKIAVDNGYLSVGEAEKMAEHLNLGRLSDLAKLQVKAQTGDDICPECGNQFDVQDDYLCVDCRAKMQ